MVQPGIEEQNFIYSVRQNPKTTILHCQFIAYPKWLIQVNQNLFAFWHHSDNREVYDEKVQNEACSDSSCIKY